VVERKGTFEERVPIVVLGNLAWNVFFSGRDRLDQQAREKGFYEQHSFCPTAVHGVFDYAGAIGLIASPFMFGFADLGGIAVFLPIVLGAGLLLYSLLTDYELGMPAIKVIPMSLHVSVDFLASAFLAVAPFIFGYKNLGLNVWLPQVIAGISVILLVLVSKTSPRVNATSLTAAA
jgi:hypothetical protein